MNIAELLTFEQLTASSAPPVLDSYQLAVLSDYIEKEQRKSAANNNPFVFFYEDVIAEPLEFSFSSVLRPHSYELASDDARCCLHICSDFSRLTSWNVYGWLQNALKFTDHLVLHYIQDHRRETPKSYDKMGVERCRYKHLSEKEGNIALVGTKLDLLYYKRNGLEHRTRVNSDGTQELLRPQRVPVYKLVVREFPEVLRLMLGEFKHGIKVN
jgi:hypothetical protein